MTNDLAHMKKNLQNILPPSFLCILLSSTVPPMDGLASTIRMAGPDEI